MHLTYNRRNMIGDGCAEPANAGLSDFGRAVIAEMNRVGVIADCAHSGWQTSLEAAKASRKPAVASHSGCLAMNRHIRCKPDEVIRALADSGGYIGSCCIPGFLGGAGDISVMLNHIDHVKRQFGADYVAIGTDIAYMSSANAAEARKIPARRRRTGFQALWPLGSLGNGDRTGTLQWTNWPLFTVGMVQRGYSDVEIQKILSGNVLRVARAVLPPRA
jgi:membrane dipeptidase